MYELTRAGMEDLHAHAEAIAATSTALDRFLTRYEEFAALHRRTGSADPLTR